MAECVKCLLKLHDFNTTLEKVKNLVRVISEVPTSRCPELADMLEPELREFTERLPSLVEDFRKMGCISHETGERLRFHASKLAENVGFRYWARALWNIADLERYLIDAIFEMAERCKR